MCQFESKMQNSLVCEKKIDAPNEQAPKCEQNQTKKNCTHQTNDSVE